MPPHRRADRSGLSGRIAWTFFEFAGGPFFVMVQIFVFAPFFANVIVEGDPVKGQAYWGYTGGIAGFVIALCSPMIGAIADQYGPRKPGIAIFTALSLPFMAALWFAMPGAVVWAGAASIAASIMFELAFVFHNAMLPTIAPPHRIGLTSAAGYAMSYAGAIVAFAIWLALPAFGVGSGAADDHAQARASGLISLVFAALFVIPLLLFTPDTARTGKSLASCVGSGLRSLGSTISKVRHYRNIAIFMVARMIYYDGLTAVFAFVGIYAATSFGWGEEAGLYGLLIIITAAISAVIGGVVDDAVGSRVTILVSLVCFSICLAANLGTDPRHIFFVFPIEPAHVHDQLPFVGALLSPMGFDTLAEQVFVLVGIGGGLFVGPALSSSRTMMARLAPEAQMAEFFGLYNLTGRATAFLAPLAIGITTQASQDQRAGLGVIFIFIAIGFVLLLTVREERAISPED